MMKSRRVRWAGHVARMGKRNTYKLVVAGRKETIGIPIRRWVDNIKMDLTASVV
jgi:hypothetical protein